MKRDEIAEKLKDLSRTLEEREREKEAALLAKSLDSAALVMLRFSVALTRVLQIIGVKLENDGVRTIEALDKLLCQDTLMSNNEMAGKEKDLDLAGLIRISKNNETDNKDNM